MKAIQKVVLMSAIVMLGFGFQGCAKKKGSSTADAANAGNNSVPTNSSDNSSFDSSDLSRYTPDNVIESLNMINIYFDFDQSALKDGDRAFLKVLNQALKMDKNKGISIKIEGNCDERGSNEYNLALGERRARSVAEYLVNLGTAKKRADVVSFGEEKPAEVGSTEAAWAKNRRVAFEVKR